MPGFLLEDDAIAARQTAWDAWMDERKQQAEAAKQAAAAAIKPVVQTVQQVAQPVAQAAQATGDYMATLNAEQQARAQQFDQWLQSRPQPEPAQVTQPTPPPTPVAGQATAVAMPSLSHAEEPATSTDTLAAPDLGGRWKTQFDFGSTYTGNYRTGTPHRGVDLVPTKGGIGTEVSAFHPGTVSQVSRDTGGAGGLMVWVRDDQGLTHTYMHLQGADVKVGDKVTRGQRIATMGESGTEGSPHLHYEVRRNLNGDPNDNLIDPRPYMAGMGGASRTAGAAPAAQPSVPVVSGARELLEGASDRVRGQIDIIAQASAKTGVPQAIIAAIMDTEAGGPKSESPAGAKGFMQVMPFHFKPGEDPFDPVTNITRGAEILADNFKRLGAWDKAAAAYFGAVDAAGNIVRGARDAVGMTGAGYVERFQNLFNQYRPLDQAGAAVAPVKQAVDSARAGAESALTGAVEASGRARDQATSLLSSTQQTGDLLRQEAEAAKARYDQWQAEQQRNASEFSASTQRMLSQAYEPMAQSPAVAQARQMAQDFTSQAGQRVQDFAAENLAPPGGVPYGPPDPLIRPGTVAESFGAIGRGLQGANIEAERQMNEPPSLGAARFGAGLVGQTLPPEVEQGLRSASRGNFMDALLLDPGGVVSAGLKSGGLSSTVNLPILGEVPLADILGLATNFLVPTGMEGRFASAPRSMASAAERAARPNQQWGIARDIGTGLTGAKQGAMDQATAMRMAISGAGRWSRASVEQIADEISRSPVGDFLRNEAGELDADALMQAAAKIKQEVTRVYSGGPEPMAAERPSMGGGTTGISQSPTFLRESLRRMYPGAINKAAAKEATQNSIDASRGFPGAETHVSVDNAEKTIAITDQGKGMTPETMEDVFVKLGGSQKPAGASGGMGTAIKAVMANAEDTWVRTIGRDPDNPNQFTDAIMHGSGDDFLGGTMHRFYARLGEMPDAELRGAPTEILNLQGGPNITGTAIWTKPMADVNWDEYTLNSWINRFNQTSRISDQSVRFTVDGMPVGSNEIVRGTAGSRSTAPIYEAGKATQLLKTVSTPGAEIDFYGSQATSESGYAEVRLLNNGQYQADQFVQLPGNAKMPQTLVADVRATVDPKGVGYPWTADRNSLIDTAQKAIKDYIATELAGDLMAQENTRVGDTIRKAPNIVGKLKLVDDAGIQNTSANDTFQRVISSPEYKRLATITNDLHESLIAELEGRSIPAPGGAQQIGLSKLVGLAVSDKWLGLNVPPSFTPWAAEPQFTRGVLMNPWAVWMEVERAWPGATRAEQISRFTDGLLATMVHEISHNTAVGGHSEEFAGILTRVPQFLGSRMQAAITSNIRSRLEKVWATLGDQLSYDANEFSRVARESSLERFGTAERSAGRAGASADNPALLDQGGAGARGRSGGPAVPPGGAPEGPQPLARLGGVAPEAAMGGAAGATGEEDLSPQERLYRGLGGAFVAGALRNKNQTVAAFENIALRKGATAKEIAAAVQTARQQAGQAYKFAGPIADAVNKVFDANPGKDAVLAARTFLRSFEGNLAQAAPPTARSDAGMARLHNRLLELARQGETQRFWYTNASEAIKEAAQGDKVKAEKLAQLFAIYSPGATVSANTQMALAAWHQWLEGAPIAVGKTDLDKKASALLYDNKPWNGRKTNNFYRNLMKRIDPDVWQSWGRQDGQTGTTVDIWMMRALQYLQDAPSMGKGGQYEFSQRAIERVAKELGWQPDEAQAAIWSSVKAASEGTGLTEAGYHYGTGLAERAAQVGGPNLPDIFKDETGQDILAKAAGLFGREGQIPSPAEKASRTLYDEAGNPIYNPKKLVKGVKEAMSEVIPEAKGALSAQAQRTIDAYAAARAFVQKLPEIKWSRVFVEPKPTQRDSNSLAVFLGRTITPEESEQLVARIGGQVDIVETQDGAIVVNLGGRHERAAGDPLAGQWIGESNVDFHKRANAALAELDTVEEASTSPFRAHTNTLTNDWEANPNGESYAAVIGRSARAEALWDVARPLAARAGEAITSATAEPIAGATRAATELGGAALSGAQDIARPRLADTGLAQGLRGALQPTDAEVLAAASPQARANAERLLSMTTDAPTEADIANALRASELGAGAAGGMKTVGKAASRFAARESGQASAQFAANLGGGAAGVAASEATMSEEDRANPWVRITRDLAFGGAGLAAPGVAKGVANQAMGRTPSLADLAAIRSSLGAKQMPLGPLPSQTMTPGQLISAVGKQNLLAGIPTHLANIGSQLVELVRMPGAAAVSGRGDEAYIGLRAAVGSVPEALKQFRDTFTSGISTTSAPGQQTQKWLPIFRFIGATDDFFRVMGGHMGSAMEAQHLVNESGATSASAIQGVLKANEGQIFKAGEKTGAASVFQAMGAQGAQDMQTPFGRWKESLLGALPSGPGVGPWARAGGKQAFGLLVDALVPFSGMPARLFDIGIGRLPVIGETRHAIQLGRALAKGDKRAAQEALGDLGVQSIVSGVIVSNTLAGNVTGPDNKEHPNSVKINGTWVDYSRWGAFQLPLAIPAATIEAWKLTGNKPDAKELDYLSAVGNAWFKTARNAFFLDSAFDLVERIGGGSGVGALGQTATSYTDRISPSFINQVEQAMDANIRQVSREFPRSVVERAASRIPYLAQMLPAQVEMTTGGARIRERQGPLGVLVGAETGVQPKVESELYRLRDQEGYRDLSVPREAPTTVSVGGSTIRLTEAEQQAVARERGKLIDQMAGEFVRGAGYAKLTDQEKALTLKRLMDRAEGRNEALWLAMTPSAEVERRMAAGRNVAGRREPAGVGR